MAAGTYCYCYNLWGGITKCTPCTTTISDLLNFPI
jgi:hypothetical protein